MTKHPFEGWLGTGVAVGTALGVAGGVGLGSVLGMIARRRQPPTS